MLEENTFGTLLKIIRQKSKLLLVRKGIGWTQKEVAKELGVSHRLYVGWENGESIPSHSDLKNIEALFSLDTEAEDTLYRAAAQVPPEIHNIPYLQNPFFTGREVQLKQLEQLLVENKSVATTHPISISGLGGIGKTQLALQYAHSHHPKPYRAVFWVNAAEESTLQASYDDLAHLLELPERNEQKLERRIKAVKRWLEVHTKWLLILDNADNLQLARSFLPVKYRGHILLTTRSQIVGTLARQIEIEKMEPEDGLLFLLLRSGKLQDKTKLDTIAPDICNTARELVTLLGNYPLALDQAGAYIEETSASLREYMQLYHEKRHSLLDRRGSEKSAEGEHPDTVAATVELSFRKACAQHPLAADLLCFCSFLQPDAIPEEVLQQDDVLRLDTEAFNEAIAALRRYSLIKRNAQEKTLSIHRLVQAVIIDTISPELSEQWKERIVRVLNVVFPKVEFKVWKQCERLLPHALACATWTEHELAPSREVAELLHKAGFYLRERGQYSEAEPLLVRALSIREQQLGAEHFDTASVLKDLAALYVRLGKFDQAETLYQRALMIRENQLGVEHLDIAESLHNLAELYRRQGKFEQAEPLCQRALMIRENQLVPEHPDTARSLNGLAMLYQQQSNYEQAEVLWLRALAIFERQPGTDRFYAAYPLHGLARLRQDQGDHEQAEALYQRALNIQELLLGSTHVHSKSFAKFLRRIGRDTEATAVESNQRKLDTNESFTDSKPEKIFAKT